MSVGAAVGLGFFLWRKGGRNEDGVVPLVEKRLELPERTEFKCPKVAQAQFELRSDSAKLLSEDTGKPSDLFFWFAGSRCDWAAKQRKHLLSKLDIAGSP